MRKFLGVDDVSTGIVENLQVTPEAQIQEREQEL
jgi:hypothetical protein